MPFEHVSADAGARVPDAHRLVEATRQHARAVRRERDRAYPAAVPGEHLDAATRRHFPDPDRRIGAAGHREPTSLVDGEGADLGLVAEKVGSSSVVYRIGLFQGDPEGEGARAAAEGRFVHVYVDNAQGGEGRGVQPIPEEIRRVVVPLLRG